MKRAVLLLALTVIAAPAAAQDVDLVTWERDRAARWGLPQMADLGARGDTTIRLAPADEFGLGPIVDFSRSRSGKTVVRVYALYWDTPVRVLVRPLSPAAWDAVQRATASVGDSAPSSALPCIAVAHFTVSDGRGVRAPGYAPSGCNDGQRPAFDALFKAAWEALPDCRKIAGPAVTGFEKPVVGDCVTKLGKRL